MPARPPPAKGGARPGSGRKLGAATQKTREIADKAAGDGISPLEILLLDMRTKLETGDLAGAADRARDCAPYMHPRLSSSNVAVRRIESLREISDGELAALAGAARAEDADSRTGLPH